MKCLAAGELINKLDYYRLNPYDSPIKEANQGWFFCCFDYEGKVKTLFTVSPNTTKNEYIDRLLSVNKCFTNLCRILSFLLHFSSYYLILYPFILVLGMIPFIGVITSFVLILFAFIISVISYLFILIISWVFTRPLFALILSSNLLIFIYFGIEAKIKYGNNGTEDPNNNQEKSSNRLFIKKLGQTFLKRN